MYAKISSFKAGSMEVFFLLPWQVGRFLREYGLDLEVTDTEWYC